MSNFFQNMMNFINENTILLICICGFLILVLIGYLIDSSIKARKLELSFDNDNESETTVSNAEINENETKIFEPEISNIKNENENPVINDKLNTILNEETDSQAFNYNIEEKVDTVKEEVINKPIVDSFSNTNLAAEDINNQEDKDKKDNSTTNYTNNKKLSDILGSIGKTEENSDSELDRIMKKLDENKINDKTLEETTNFNNLF